MSTLNGSDGKIESLFRSKSLQLLEQSLLRLIKIDSRVLNYRRKIIVNMMGDYEERAKTLSFADKDEIKALVLAQGSEVVFLDVRGDTEIAEEPLKGDYKIVCIPCSRTDATELASKAVEILPNKEGECCDPACGRSTFW